MTDSFLKMHLSYFYCKKWVSITPILYLFSVALASVGTIGSKDTGFLCTSYRADNAGIDGKIESWCSDAWIYGELYSCRGGK